MANPDWSIQPATNGFNIQQGCETIAEHVPRRDIALKIAAVPEMVEACRIAWNDIVRLYTGQPDENFDDNAAVKAIEKAMKKAGVTIRE